jgi:hypothetical protein
VCAQGGKNDIVSAAAGYIRDLEGRKQWLRARNDELLEQAARAGSSMVVKVRAKSEQHSVAVDVFETVLRRLKAMEELRVTGIRSCFHDGGMWMDITVRCEVRRSLVPCVSLRVYVYLTRNGYGQTPCQLNYFDPRKVQPISKTRFQFQGY